MTPHCSRKSAINSDFLPPHGSASDVPCSRVHLRESLLESEASKWFAIHAKPRRETFAEANVRALACEVFLPKLKVEISRRRRKQFSYKPLFRGYFFARFYPEISLGFVKCAPGVLQVVSSGRFPIPVDNAIIQEIQDRMDEDGYVAIRQPTLMPGDLVSIDQGPLRGMMGRVEQEQDDRNRVAILLETLWNARLLIEQHFVQPALV